VCEYLRHTGVYFCTESSMAAFTVHTAHVSSAALSHINVMELSIYLRI